MIRELIKKHEGVRLKVYKDSLGIPTVGVGFNLNRPDANAVLASVGAKHADVVAGKPLTDAQVDALLDKDLDACEKDLEALIPDIRSFPVEAQAVLMDLRFNLGGAGHIEFGRMRLSASVARSLTSERHGTNGAPLSVGKPSQFYSFSQKIQIAQDLSPVRLSMQAEHGRISYADLEAQSGIVVNNIFREQHSQINNYTGMDNSVQQQFLGSKPVNLGNAAVMLIDDVSGTAKGL